MCEEETHALKPNLTVLCHTCKLLRGDLSYLEFFTEKELQRTHHAHLQLLEKILQDPEALHLIKKWYRQRSSTTRAQKPGGDQAINRSQSAL